MPTEHERRGDQHGRRPRAPTRGDERRRRGALTGSAALAGSVARAAGLAIAAALVAALAAGLVIAAPGGIASAASTRVSAPGVTLDGGCRGSGSSHRQDGALLGEASAPEVPGATSSRPLRLVPGGTVSWAGSTPAVVTGGHWWLHVDGIPIRSGGSPNAAHVQSASGVVHVGSYVPVWLGLTGVYYVTGELSGKGGACTGALYVDLTGDPATGALLWAGIVLVLAGLALLVGVRPTWVSAYTAVPSGSRASYQVTGAMSPARTLRRHPVAGFLGGLVLGIGAVVLLALFGVGPFSSWWPFAAVAGGFAVLGVLAGLVAPARGSRT